jgi:hypothetical protein
MVAFTGYLFSEPLFELVRPHLPDGMDGAVFVDSRKLGRFPVPYRSYFIKRQSELGAHRPPDRRNSRDTLCRDCGRRFLGSIANSRTISEWDWGDRRMAIGEFGNLLADDQIIRELRLKERFPDLGFERIEVVPDPADTRRFRYKQLADLIRGVQRLAMADPDEDPAASTGRFPRVLDKLEDGVKRPIKQIRGTGNLDLLTDEQHRELDDLIANAAEAAKWSSGGMRAQSGPLWNVVRGLARGMIERHDWAAVPEYERFEPGSLP